MKRLLNLLIFFLALSQSVMGQDKRIKILPSENISYRDEANFPGADILIGEVKIAHEGAILTCKKAFYYQEKNFFKAIGDVKINQGDTLIQTSDYVDYDADRKFALSWGNVILRDLKMTLTTDTLSFNREDQIMIYDTSGKIVDGENILTSNRGKYFAGLKKFTAKNDVVVTTPKDTIYSDHLDYYTEIDQAYLYGPSDIYSEGNHIYTEKGFYDANTQISHLVKNAKIDYGDRLVQGDSLYYDAQQSFASASGNFKLTDTLNNWIQKGDYAEVFRELDSVFITKRAVAVTEMENDSLYIHGDTMVVTGPADKRIIKAAHFVKFFKSDFRGKCDSLVYTEEFGKTKMYYEPVIWAEENQITGDSIFVLSNLETNQLDSLKILNNAFMVSSDSLGYNQIRGKNMLGKFRENKLHSLLVNGNAEVLNYGRDESGELIGITKKQASKIKFFFNENKVIRMNFMSQPDGNTYPLSQFPETEVKLKGFIWREEEKPLVVEDIFLKGARSKARLTKPATIKSIDERSIL